LLELIVNGTRQTVTFIKFTISAFCCGICIIKIMDQTANLVQWLDLDPQLANVDVLHIIAHKYSSPLSQLMSTERPQQTAEN